MKVDTNWLSILIGFLISLFYITKPNAMNALKESIIKIVEKHYKPLSTVEITYRSYLMRLHIDGSGKTIRFIIGTKNEQGTIVGEQYIRRLRIGVAGELYKNHWVYQDPATFIC